MHCEYPDSLLITKTHKKLSVERWTLLTFNGCHLGYLAEGEGPLTHFQADGNGGQGSCNVVVLKIRNFLNKTELLS